jgi:hypothetical protein
MPGEVYYAQTIKIKNPLSSYGYAKILLGLLSLALSVPLLTRLEPKIPALALDLRGNELYFALLTMAGLVSLVWLFWGIKSFVTGMKNLARIVVPPRTPPDFKDGEEIENAFTRKEMPIYQMAQSGPLAVARKYLSDRVAYMTPTTRDVVEMNVNYVRRVIVFIVIVAVLVFARGFLPPDVLHRVSPPEDFLSFPALFVGILVAVAVFRIYTTFRLLPDSLPRCDALETIVTAKGAGDPFQLPAAIEEKFLSIRTQGMPNRVIRTGFQEKEGGVENTGRFEGKIFVETQPTQVELSSPAVVTPYLMAGVLLLAASMYILIREPHQPEGDYQAQMWQGADLFWGVLKGLVFASIGSGILKQAHRLLAVFRYESLITFVTVEGSYGRSEVKAGKAITDSFETSNTVVRSDCHSRVYVASTLTEHYSLDGDRHIIGMVVSSEANNVQDLARDVFKTFEKKGVTVRGIDIGSESIEEIARANILYQQQKRLAGAQPAGQRLASGESTHLKEIPDHPGHGKSGKPGGIE